MIRLLPFFLSLDFWSAASGFVGTLLIFFFGLPPKIDPEGHIGLIAEQTDREEMRKGKTYKDWGHTGVLLLSISFVLQLLRLILTT